MVHFKRYEQLSKLVKMYPCLYIKEEKDFREHRTWKEIAKELDLENGKVVEQLWKSEKTFLPKSVFFAFCFFQTSSTST